MNIKLPNDLIESAGICQNCFIKFNEIDEHQAIVDKIQQDLLVLFNTTQTNAQDTKTDVKLLEEEVEVAEVYVNDEEILTDDEYLMKDIKPQLEGVYKIEEIKKRRGPKKKRNLDEGLIMVEVDGFKFYQCDVCRKVFKDRYKLKIHKETHNVDRNICCNECGAM